MLCYDYILNLIDIYTTFDETVIDFINVKT